MDLSYNQLISLKNLDFSLKKLVKLSLKKNLLEDLIGIEKFPFLNYLKLSRNNIKDFGEIDRLKSLAKLKGVSLYRNPMSDNKRVYAAQVLKVCKELESLDHNSIAEIRKRYMLSEDSEEEKSEVQKIVQDAETGQLQDDEDLLSSHRENNLQCKKLIKIAKKFIKEGFNDMENNNEQEADPGPINIKRGDSAHHKKSRNSSSIGKDKKKNSATANLNKGVLKNVIKRAESDMVDKKIMEIITSPGVNLGSVEIVKEIWNLRMNSKKSVKFLFLLLKSFKNQIIAFYTTFNNIVDLHTTVNNIITSYIVFNNIMAFFTTFYNILPSCTIFNNLLTSYILFKNILSFYSSFNNI